MKRRRRANAAAILLFTILFAIPLAGAQEGDWLRLELRRHSSGVLYGATSELEDPGPGAWGQYGPERLFDRDPGTAWSEGVPGDGLGEAIYVAVEPGTVALGFRSGFARNDRLFEANNRPRFLRLTLIGALNLEGFATEYATVYDGKALVPTARIPLEDRRTAQRAELPFNWDRLEEGMASFLESEEVREMRFPQAREMGLGPEAPIPMDWQYVLRIEIESVYHGDRWADTCIAELWPDYGPVAAVSVSEDGSALISSTEAGYEPVVYRNDELVMELAATSPEAEWVILTAVARGAQEGRRESEYLLVNSSTGHELTEEITGSAYPLLLGFEPGRRGPRVLVGEPGETKSFLCELYPFNEATR